MITNFNYLGNEQYEFYIDNKSLVLNTNDLNELTTDWAMFSNLDIDTETDAIDSLEDEITILLSENNYLENKVIEQETYIDEQEELIEEFKSKSDHDYTYTDDVETYERYQAKRKIDINKEIIRLQKELYVYNEFQSKSNDICANAIDDNKDYKFTGASLKEFIKSLG